MTPITLVLGGTRSGKSAIAEAITEALQAPVTYVATAFVNTKDEDHNARIAAHRLRRPTHWTTVECSEPSDLARCLSSTSDVVLVDSLGTWVTLHPELEVDSAELLSALTTRRAPTVIVAEEVGLSVHRPPRSVGATSTQSEPLTSKSPP